MTLPKVTVIIANYNNEEYLDKAIESAFNQNYEGSLCVCVIDDGSTDDSWDIIGTHFVNAARVDQSDKLETYYESNIGRFNNTTYIAIRQDNAGPSAARNTGIAYTISDTDYYAILDADDEMYENKISKCIDVAIENKISIGVVYADYDTFHVATGKKIREFKEPYSRRRLIEECIVHSGSIINKLALEAVREETGFYDETMRTCEDYDLWMRISEKYILCHVPEALTLVRVTGENSSEVVNQEIWQKNWLRVMEKLQQRANV